MFKNELPVLLYKCCTNIYVKTYKSMQISHCRQVKTVVSDNFKRNLHDFNMKKGSFIKRQTSGTSSDNE